jgi:class 3 adenylate cyclase
LKSVNFESIFIGYLQKSEAPASFPMRAPLNLAEPDPSLARLQRGDATLLSGANYTLFKNAQSLHPSSMPAALVASVAFLKIQDFARRSATEQARLRAQLQAVVAVTAAEIAPAGRVMLDAADGAAVVVLDDPRGALRLAERALTAVAVGLPLSAGVNHGALQLSGRKGGEGMTGDGIAVAAAVAAFAGPSRILVSRSFRDALAEVAPGLEAALAPAGTFTDPGLRTHELFSPDDRALARRSRRYTAIAAVLAIALIGGGVAVRSSTADRQPFMDVVLEKYPYWRDLVQKVSY